MSCAHTHTKIYKNKFKHTCTWWMVASTLQRLFVIVFWGNFNVTAKWEPLTVRLMLCDKRNRCLYRPVMKSPIKARTTAFIRLKWIPDPSSFLLTMKLCVRTPSSSHPLSSLPCPASPLSSACIFPNSLPPSHKTRDLSVSHDGEGWKEVKQTMCSAVLTNGQRKRDSVWL